MRKTTIPPMVRIDLREQSERRRQPFGRRAADAEIAKIHPRGIAIGRRATDSVPANDIPVTVWDRRYE